MRLAVRALVWRLAFALLFVAGTARADDIPILGDWVIIKAVVAPWVKPNENRAPIEADLKAHLQMRITFEPTRVIAKDPTIACSDVDYERTLFAPEAIFQGNLPEPNQAEIARNLGFPKGDIPGFDVDCSTGLFSYHFADMNTMLFALNDVIYWLDREIKKS